MNELINYIVDKIIEVYGSLEEPTYQFTHITVQDSPYKYIISELEKRYSIADIMDNNDDVSFIYKIKHDNQTLILHLSMVDKFGILARESEVYECYGLITSKTNNLTEIEQNIRTLLDNNNILLLGKDILNVHIPMNLFVAEKEDACIFQALFSDYSVVPDFIDV